MKSNYEVAQEVLTGVWGNGAERRERLTAAGYHHDSVQSIVNALVADRDKVTEEKPEIVNSPLEIDYDPSLNDGIIINVIVG